MAYPYSTKVGNKLETGMYFLILTLGSYLVKVVVIAPCQIVLTFLNE